MEKDDGFGIWVWSLAKVVEVAIGAEAADDFGAWRGVNVQALVGSGLNFPTLGNTTVTGYFGGNFTFHAVPSLPQVTIRFSQAEVCWGSETNVQYQVQYQSALTTNAWLNLGSPLPGTGTNTCVNDAIPRGEPQRFYRILGTPLP